MLYFTNMLSAQIRAEKGVLDLRSYSFSEQGALNVKGEWEFYWQKVLDPVNPSMEQGVYVEVPLPWKQLEDKVPDIGTKGFASYKLKVLLPPDTRSLGLRFTDVFSASAYYVNGQNIGFNGFPGTNRFQSVFEYAPSMHIFPVQDTILDLLVHVSNFEHRSGGIRGRMVMGTPMQIMSARADRLVRDFFLVGAFLIIGIYFMGLYLMRSELYKLYFSLTCLMMVFRILVLSDTEIFRGDWISGIGRLRLEYLSFAILVPLFVMMIRNVFPNDFPSLIYKIIIGACATMVLIVILTPVSFFTIAITVYFYLVIIASVVVFYTIILGWKRGRMHAPAFAIGIAIVFAGGINDMMFITDIVNTSFISHYTMFVYLIIYSLIFSSKSNQDYVRAEKLSKEIVKINENLESIVRARTDELKRKSDELLQHQEELEQRNESLQREVSLRDTIFTIIGHDVKAPVGYTHQMLEMILKGDIPREEEISMLKTMANGSRATITLLENLLAWGRSQSGELNSIAVSFSLWKVANEIIELYDLPLKEKKIRLNIGIKKTDHLYADKEHVRLILRNLLANAIKFTRAGGEIFITSAMDKESGMCSITVKDNGIGISPKDMKDLFGNGKISSVTGTQNEKGSGIGLKLCKRLVELNKGSIQVTSTPGEGASFRVELPTHPEN